MKKYENAKIEFVSFGVKEDILTGSGYWIDEDGAIDAELDFVNKNN